MDYVMVPVPEELVDEVTDYLAWQVKAPKIAENPEALATVVAEADETMRSFILAIATATADDIRPTLRETAAGLDVSIREVVGIVGDANNRVRRAGRAGPLVMVRPDPRPQPADVSEWEHRIIHMNKVDAEAILS